MDGELAATGHIHQFAAGIEEDVSRKSLQIEFCERMSGIGSERLQRCDCASKFLEWNTVLASKAVDNEGFDEVVKRKLPI